MPSMTASLREVQRALLARLDGIAIARDEAGALELVPDYEHTPTIRQTALLQRTSVAAHAVGAPEAHFSAFLDGKQKSVSAAYRGAVPLVFGTVAAAVRARVERRALTHSFARESRLYFPFSSQLAPLLEVGMPVPVDDTSLQGDDPHTPLHPSELQRRAYQRVEAHREQLEQKLALGWLLSAGNDDVLLVDGGISAHVQLSQSDQLVGVVKSHHTLYCDGPALPVVLGLEEGERSSVFRVESRTRTTVASWYLRLRWEPGRDPLWGLVRVELAMGNASEDRADEVSRWLLAERAPITLPDKRWDRLLYGVRDCEMFLTAVL